MKGYYFEGYSRSHMTQINMRVSQKTATAFRQFCYEQKLTQNEGLAILLTQVTESTAAENALRDEIKFYKNELALMNQKYTAAIEQPKAKEESDWKRVRDWTKIMRDMLSYILDHKAADRGPRIKPGYFKRDHERVQFNRYRYPEEAGCTFVQLDDFIYSKGRSPALFILAHHVNEHGEIEYLKFRYYPRDRFVGIPLRATSYSYRNASWLIGHMPAPDGAMDVYAALPVDGIMPSNKLLDAAENMIPKSDLDRTIMNAERRRKKP